MKRIITSVPLLFLLNCCTFDKGEVPTKQIPCGEVSYTRHIWPIISDRCIHCHYSGGSGPGDFTSFHDLEEAAEEGALKRRLLESPVVTEEQKRLIFCWIEEGAPNN